MTHHENQTDTIVHRAWISTVLSFAGLLLGLLALVVTIEGLSGSAAAPTALTTLINLATAVFGIAGAIGYWLGKKWGTYSFALSVLGHIVAHVQLLLSAIASGRTSPSAAIGLAVIPVITSVVLIGMLRQSQRQARG